MAGVLLAVALFSGSVRAAPEEADVEQRLAQTARYLASDDLEGRGIGSRGLELAAQHIAAKFAKYGLKTDLYDGTPFQTFHVRKSAKLGRTNTLALVGPAPENDARPTRIELKLGADFTPMAMSGSGRFDLPLVFVGYGITGKEEGYDDYAGIDVAGKAVVVLRHEPQQADPNSVFNGTDNSQHAPLRRKVSNASQHNAAAVIFCTDELEIRRTVDQAHKQWQKALDRLAEEHAKLKNVESPSPEQIEDQRKRIEQLAQQVEASSSKLREAYDPVLPFAYAGRGTQQRDFPVMFCRRAPIDRAVAASLRTDLSALERQIDDGPAPHSRPLDGWRAVGEVEVQQETAEVKNVVAVLEAEGPLAEETLILGAHYDHLGRRETGSAPGAEDAIYNGADDNASGVAVLLEVARTLAARPEKLRRNVVCIAFAAEERGLLGSKHYVRHPLFPLDRTIAMLNLDVVGRLRDDKLTVGGSGTAEGFGMLLDQVNPSHGFQLTKRSDGYGPSDHAAFYGEKIPVMHFFTGVHRDIHRPGDEFEKLNIAGMRRIAGLTAEVAAAVANAEERPKYVSVPSRRARPGGGQRPLFGSIPDLTHEGPGYAISGVSQGSPAQRAGLAAGDVIVRLGESRIGNLEDFDGALRQHKAGDRVQVVVRRGDQERVFDVTLDPPN